MESSFIGVSSEVFAQYWPHVCLWSLTEATSQIRSTGWTWWTTWALVVQFCPLKNSTETHTFASIAILFHTAAVAEALNVWIWTSNLVHPILFIIDIWWQSWSPAVLLGSAGSHSNNTYDLGWEIWEPTNTLQYHSIFLFIPDGINVLLWVVAPGVWHFLSFSLVLFCLCSLWPSWSMESADWVLPVTSSSPFFLAQFFLSPAAVVSVAQPPKTLSLWVKGWQTDLLLMKTNTLCLSPVTVRKINQSMMLVNFRWSSQFKTIMLFEIGACCFLEHGVCRLTSAGEIMFQFKMFHVITFYPMVNDSFAFPEHSNS